MLLIKYKTMKNEDIINERNGLADFLQESETPESSFEQIVQSLKAITVNVLDGLIDEDLSYLQLDTIEKLAKDCKNQIKESVISELNRNDGFMQRGDKILKVVAGRAMYSFNSNPEYKKLLERKKEIETEMKGLVSVFEGQTNPFEVSEDGSVWNPATGEQVYIAEKTFGKETVMVTTKKEK